MWAWKKPSRQIGIAWAGLGGVLFLYALAALSYAELPHSDEIDFVNQSTWIAERGIFSFLEASFTGQYPFENKHPGIPLLISAVAERSPAGVRPMRFGALLLVLAMLGVLFWISRRRLGSSGALALITFLALGHAWIVQARQVLAEPLFYGAFFLCWRACCGTQCTPNRVRWGVAGALVGVAYLVKGSANLLLLALPPAVVLYALLNRWRPLHSVPESAPAGPAWTRGFLFQACLFVLFFAACASPVLVNAALKHGQPFYSQAGALMWMDDWSQIDEVLAGRLQPTFSDYMARNGMPGLLRRVGSGLQLYAEHIPHLFHSSLPLSPFLSSLWVLLAAWGWWALRGRWERVFTAVLLAVATLLYAFYAPIAENNLRHVMTLCPVLLYLAILGARDLWVRWWFGRRRTSRSAWRGWSRGAGLLAPAALVGLALYAVTPPAAAARNGAWAAQNPELYQVGPWIRWKDLAWPSTPLAASPGYLQLAEWMQVALVERKEAAFQTEYLCPRHQVHWLLPEVPRLYNVPAVNDLVELSSLAEKLSVRYLVLEAPSWERRRKIFQPYIQVRDGTLHVDLPGWRLVWADPDRPSTYFVFERER